MSLTILFRVLFFVLLSCSCAISSPFLISDPELSSVGAGYEILEVTKAFPAGRLTYSGNNEPDGSIRMDLNGVPLGTHEWKVRYVLNGNYSSFVNCILIVKSLYYKNDVKTFRYYSVTKSWTLKVPK